MVYFLHIIYVKKNFNETFYQFKKNNNLLSINSDVQLHQKPQSFHIPKNDVFDILKKVQQTLFLDRFLKEI